MGTERIVILVALATLSEILVDESTRWRVIIVPGWYGAGKRTIEIASATAVWRRCPSRQSRAKKRRRHGDAR